MNAHQMTGKVKSLSITTHLAEELVAFSPIMGAVLTAVSKQAMTTSHLYE